MKSKMRFLNINWTDRYSKAKYVNLDYKSQYSNYVNIVVKKLIGFTIMMSKVIMVPDYFVVICFLIFLLKV